MSDVEGLSREELIRLLKRSNFVKDQLSSRLGSVVSENLELMGVIQELQIELQEARMPPAEEVPHPEVLADVTS